MKEQVALQRILQKRLAESQEKNASFSMRALASKIGINPGTLSSIICGKRKVSKKLAQNISHALMLDPQERHELLSHFPEKQHYKKEANREASDVVDPKYLQLTSAQFRVMSDWEHLAVLSLMKTTNFQSSPAWIAERLGIGEKKAAEVVERLIMLELVERKSDGSLQRLANRLRSSDDIVDISVRKAHLQTLELAKESVHKNTVKTRDLSSVTFAIDLSKLAQAKERIRQFQDDLAEFLTEGSPSEVYRLSVQLFPLTVIKGEKND